MQMHRFVAGHVVIVARVRARFCGLPEHPVALVWVPVLVFPARRTVHHVLERIVVSCPAIFRVRSVLVHVVDHFVPASTLVGDTGVIFADRMNKLKRFAMFGTIGIGRRGSFHVVTVRSRRIIERRYYRIETTQCPARAPNGTVVYSFRGSAPAQ